MPEMIEGFSVGQSTNTPLTPNSNAVCSATGDVNNDTNVVFLYNNSIPMWTPEVSSSNTSTTLGADRGNAVVTFEAGLEVDYTALSEGHYLVTVSGKIIDSGSTYSITGKSLGVFPISKQS